MENEIETSAIETKPDYIRQGCITNQLTKIRPDKNNTRIEKITGAAVVKKGKLSIKLPDHGEVSGLRASAYQLLDALSLVLTRSGEKERSVKLPLREYARIRGLKNLKELRSQVNCDLRTLSDMRLTYTDSDPKKSVDGMALCDGCEIRRSVICFTFSEQFFKLMKSYPLMPVIPQLWSVNSKKNPNAYFLLRRLLEHKNMNCVKKNANTISVRALLDSCGDIPSYDAVMSSDRALMRRIISPFERDMNSLAPAVTWRYAHPGGRALTEEESLNFDYNVFIECFVIVTWAYYPERKKRDGSVLQEYG